MTRGRKNRHRRARLRKVAWTPYSGTSWSWSSGYLPHCLDIMPAAISNRIGRLPEPLTTERVKIQYRVWPPEDA